MKKITWLMAFMMSLTASAQGLEGVWKGKLQAGPQALTLVLHVEPGQGKVTIDVIEQSADNIAMLKNHLSSNIVLNKLLHKENEVVMERNPSSLFCDIFILPPLALAEE